jgi:hypothetical protein
MKTGRAHIFVVLCAIVLASVTPAPGTAASEEGWKVEMEEVCAKTDISMTLSREELQVLISRCEELEKKIGMEDKVVRKIYLRRLERCRNLFAYVLESKVEEPAEGQGTATPRKPGEENIIPQSGQHDAEPRPFMPDPGPPGSIR